MNKAPGVRTRFLAGLFFLMTICTGLSVLRNWLPFRESGMSFFGWLICCTMQQDHETAMSHDSFMLAPVIVFGVFAIGVGILLLRVIQTHHRLAHLFEIAPVQTPPDQLASLLAGLNLNRQVRVVQSSEPFAFCFGFLRPRICLSSGLVALLSPAQLKAALLHEEHHRRKYDPLRILFIEVLNKMLFFLPIVREWGEMVQVRLEVMADRYAVSEAGKPALAGALHRIMVTTKSSPLSRAGMVIAGLSATAARVAALLGEREISAGFSENGLIRSAFSLGVLCLLLML